MTKARQAKNQDMVFTSDALDFVLTAILNILQPFYEILPVSAETSTLI